MVDEALMDGIGRQHWWTTLVDISGGHLVDNNDSNSTFGGFTMASGDSDCRKTDSLKATSGGETCSWMRANLSFKSLITVSRVTSRNGSALLRSRKPSTSRGSSLGRAASTATLTMGAACSQQSSVSSAESAVPCQQC
ncbi:MAG: hypothetical protein FRX49_08096 [Trebouxia sp. A1-2]|nr:MAG: hypothetical protein FRX49_08096 [Trebouxia sp. A1-2]